MSIYRFARTADDLADEGASWPHSGWRNSGHYRSDLVATAAGRPDSGRWPSVFPHWPCRCSCMRCPRRGCMPCSMPSSRTFATRVMPTAPACWTIARVRPTRSAACCCTCTASATRLSLRQSDAICSALQLINFWQDLSVDLPRDRRVRAAGRSARHGLDLRAAAAPALTTPPVRALVRELAQWAAALMAEGAPLALRLPGRVGWELRLVVQGGLRILEKIAAMDHASCSQAAGAAPRRMRRACCGAPVRMQ